MIIITSSSSAFNSMRESHMFSTQLHEGVFHTYAVKSLNMCWISIHLTKFHLFLFVSIFCRLHGSTTPVRLGPRAVYMEDNFFNTTSYEVDMDMDEDMGDTAVAFELGFVIVILWPDTTNGKTFVVLGCERGDKYRQYKMDTKTTTKTRKCDCPFRLRGRPLKNSEGWVVRVLCGSYNHDVTETLVEHPYTMFVDMTKSKVKPKNILLTLKEHNEKNVTTIRQVSPKIEMQHLMNLLECDIYIHWHVMNDEEFVCDIFWTHPDVVKLLNAFNIVFLNLDGYYKLERFSDLFHRLDGLSKVIVIDKDLALMSVVDRMKFIEVDIAGKITIKSKLCEITFPDITFMCPLVTRSKLKVHKRTMVHHPQQPVCKRKIFMLDQFHVNLHSYISNIFDVTSDVEALLGMGEDSWPLSWDNGDEYANIFGGYDHFYQIKQSLLVGHVGVDKWMNVLDMGYVIVCRYNVIFVLLSLKQNISFFPLKSQPCIDSLAQCIKIYAHYMKTWI
ncbi:hypothetical protein HKD37_09G025334 [Glycine soja]